jgi:uncharacterized protein (DUF305 family)
MIPHHRQAVEMSVLALDDARQASDSLKELARRIQAAQQPEIDLMTAWLKAWGKEVTPATDGMDHSSMEGMDHSSTDGTNAMTGMEGMMSAEEMSALAQATGTAFDNNWMNMMIRHHEGALTMAKQVQADGTNPDARELAATIIAAQEAEISEMKTMLAQ